MSVHKVVIAEDEYLILEELADMIPWDSLGLQLAGKAGDGNTALRLLETTGADLFITDIRIPVKDGLTVIEEARRKQDDLSCVIISGYSEFDYALRAIRLGVSNYLIKPVDEKMLIDTLRKIIAEKEERTHQDSTEAPDAALQDIPQNRYCKMILDYVDANYQKDISLSSLAQHLFLSEGYVGKVFSKCMGQRFNEYLNSYRIMKAIELLKTTNYRVYEISAMVGYSDYRYFSAVFKSATGRTPVDYRKA